jgi:hypothetical protein
LIFNLAAFFVVVVIVVLPFGFVGSGADIAPRRTVSYELIRETASEF